MDESVNPRRSWLTLGLIAAACLPAALAGAQELADPTRPPSAPMTGELVQATSGPVLQWIYVSQARTEAMVSGKVVRVGERLGNARVVKISESNVVLRNASGLQTLHLFPVTEKHVADGQKQSAPGDHSKNQR